MLSSPPTLSPAPLRILLIQVGSGCGAALLDQAVRLPGTPQLRLELHSDVTTAVAQAPTCDLAIVDLSGAATPGTEIVGALEARLPGLPILALTLPGDEVQVQALLQAGVLDCLPGTADSLPLLARLLRWVGHYLLSQPSATLLRRHPDPWLLMDTDGAVLMSSGAGVRILGTSTDQLTRRTFLSAVHAEDLPTLMHLLERLREAPDDTQRMRLRFQGTNGEWHWLAVALRHLAPAAGSPIIVAFREISDRVYAEQELEKLFGVVEQMADMAVITDLQGRIEYVNPAFEQQTGYSRAEALGQKPSIISSGRHPPEFYRQLWETVLSGQVYRGVLINRRKSGDVYYEDKIITPLKDRQGRITHMVSTGRDITSRIQAEYALVESEHRFRTISELASDYIYSAAVTPEGHLNLEWATDAFSDLTGYTSADLAQAGWAALIHPDDAEVYHGRRERLLTGQPDVSEYRLITRGGQTRWVRDYGRPQVDPASRQVVRILGATQDITERKQAEAVLAQLAAIVESSDDAIYSLSLDGSLTSWNSAAQQVYGYSVQEAVGQPAAMLYPPDRQAELADELQRLQRGERIAYHLTIRRRKDGRRVEVWQSSFPIRDAAGRPSGAATVGRDVTV